MTPLFAPDTRQVPPVVRLDCFVRTWAMLTLAGPAALLAHNTRANPVAVELLLSGTPVL
jgi:hypothetical protein